MSQTKEPTPVAEPRWMIHCIEWHLQPTLVVYLLHVGELQAQQKSSDLYD